MSWLSASRFRAFAIFPRRKRTGASVRKCVRWHRSDPHCAGPSRHHSGALRSSQLCFSSFSRRRSDTPCRRAACKVRGVPSEHPSHFGCYGRRSFCEANTKRRCEASACKSSICLEDTQVSWLRRIDSVSSFASRNPICSSRRTCRDHLHQANSTRRPSLQEAYGECRPVGRERRGGRRRGGGGSRWGRCEKPSYDTGSRSKSSPGEVDQDLQQSGRREKENRWTGSSVRRQWFSKFFRIHLSSLRVDEMLQL